MSAKKKTSIPAEIVDILLNSEIGRTLNEKLRQLLDLPVTSRVREEVKAGAKEAAEKIKKHMSDDPYKILGIDPDAEDVVVTAAYKAKAKKYHPDSGGSQEKMAEINRAYEEICKMRGIKR